MSGSPRIAVVTSSLALGGSEVQVAHLARGLKLAGWTVSVVALQPGPMEQELRAAGVPVQHVRIGRMTTPRRWLGLRHVLRSLGPDLVHTQAFRANLWGRLAALSAGYPVVASVRATYSYLPAAYYPAERLIARRTAAIVTPSQATSRHLASIVGVPAGLIHMIPNAVDTTLFQPLEDGAGFRSRWQVNGRFMVLAPGRLVRQKNHEGLIDAFASVVQTRPDSVLVVAGSGPLESSLKDHASRLGDGVVFVGELSRQEMAAAMSAADVVCLASRFEGMPNVILEAMASGKPVAASAVDGNEEVVEHGQSGLLTPAGDNRAMADALLELAGDPALRVRMGGNGRELAVKNHDPDLNVRRHMQLYERLLGERATESRGKQDAHSVWP